MKQNILFSFLIVLLLSSCSDNDSQPIFEPSSDLDEYVFVNTNGVERLFTSDNFINVRQQFNDNGELDKIWLSLNPEYGTYTHFIMEFNVPEVGIHGPGQVELNYLDYSLSDAFPMLWMDCDAQECPGSLELRLHQVEGVGGQLKGEFSGNLAGGFGGEASNLQFDGEFVVFVDE